MHYILTQLYRFRRDLVRLWHAMWSPRTPIDLKIIAFGLLVYVISPIDLIPDFIPVVGWIDDAILVPMVVSWLVKRLPQEPT